ncbi:MAG: hypothetical protein GX962_12585 [Epulopiscium sp.]|nr:hypothetical protein [Candidatus Epulonipiscium sp.]
MDNKPGEQGSITVIILLVFIVMFVLGGTGIFMMKNHHKMNQAHIIKEEALQYAEAGFNAYLWHLNDDVNFYSRSESDAMQEEPIPFQNGFYQLKVTKPSDDKRYVTIRSTGWLKTDPIQKQTIEVKVRKKQFVHQVYVSESEGDNIWWTTGDKTHGPYHTNGTFRVQGNPEFYDMVTYVIDYDLQRGANPKYYMGEPEKTERLEFPPNNQSLKVWAEKDGTVYTGRTCIYLMNNKIKIRKKDGSIEVIDIPKNNVLYIDGEEKPGDKWGLDTGNVFISGTLEGELTVAAKNNIYIMYDDPTQWYEDKGYTNGYTGGKPPHPPLQFIHIGVTKPYPYEGGIQYAKTTFGDPANPSVYDSDLGIWVREAKGQDMLGLVANNNVYISHYGWPKNPEDGGKLYWDYTWEWKYGAVINERGRQEYRYAWFKEEKLERLPKYNENGQVVKDRWGRVEYTDVNTTYDMAPHKITVHAAIFAVKGGFGYESYYYGPQKGNIIIWGNITQNKRLAVGLINSTGYLKQYAHDRRMFYDYPPHILEPANVGWEIRDWNEIPTL